MDVQKRGLKRPLEEDDKDNDERPVLRIRPESDICGPPDEDFALDNDDPAFPRTPPVPRSSTRDEVSEEDHEINGINDLEAGTDNTQQEGTEELQNNQPRPLLIENIKVEPGSQHVEGSEANTSSKRTENETIPIGNWFSGNLSEMPQPTAPNVATAEIAVTKIAEPVVPHYLKHTPEEELKYVKDGEIKKDDVLPTFNRDGASDADSDVSEDENVDNPPFKDVDVAKLTRYFQRNTVYTKYDFTSKANNLPMLAVHEKKTHILTTLENNRIVIIEGFTGCGKTTQVPQFIMDQCREKQTFCNIVVTQPRKIAAISVAKRVCYERCWQLGTIVGYQVGMEAKKDKDDTLLTFMTTGVLLQKLISVKSLKEFTHIIIDEVHERDLESDFLLLVIKRIMAEDKDGKEKHVKLILMSATIDTKRFESYFQLGTKKGIVQGPPVIKIPFIPHHKIDEYYLDDILSDKMDLFNIIDSNLDKDKATIQEEIYRIAVSSIIALDELERNAEPDPRLKRNLGVQKKRGAVLVFLPGMEEIKTLHRELENEKKNKLDTAENERHDPNFYKWAIYPLHSSVTADDQARVFDTPGDYYRKIILSTNIAESSVTVPDIAYVYDFCLTKSLCVDLTTNFTTLRMAWASKSQCTQRRGRAGRVSDGVVYRLVPKSFYQTLVQDITPEMRRSNLETVILMCKKFNLDEPRNLLKYALDPPKMSGIERAVSTLKELGALTICKTVPTGPGLTYDTCDGNLTFIGQVMAALPIPQQCTRLILFGHCFGVMREAIIIAAGLSVKSPFQTGFQKQLNTYLEKMKHAKKSFSDLFALYHVYKVWITNYGEGGTTGGGRRTHQEYRWAHGAMVHLSVLREIKSTVELLEERLKKLGIKDSYALQTDPNFHNPIELTSEQGMFLKLAIAGAFYPNYFLRRRPELRQYERDMNKEVNGNDVLRTVYFKGFPQDHIGELYKKHIADYLVCGLSVPTVKFDGQRVFAVFDNTTGDTIGPFNAGIFRAIKLRQLRNENLEFRVLWKEDERKAIQDWEISKQRRNGRLCPPLRSLPPIDCHSLEVRVQHVISPSQFWVVIGQDFKKLDNINNVIQSENFTRLPSLRRIYPNCLCLAPFENIYYRAKILREQYIRGGPSKCLVYFIDFGNSLWVPSSQLRDFSESMERNHITRIESLAIECRLKEIKPNTVHGPHWSEESISKMKKFCERAPTLIFKIFSIYQSIMIGEIIGCKDKSEQSQRYSLHDFLILPNENGKMYGEFAIEPYWSMENHRKRQNSQCMGREEINAASHEQFGEPLDLDFIEPPTRNLRQPVTLKGPWSPLEMNFQALVHCSNSKEVKIDNNSVNSVLLDHEPTTTTSRMLVASHTGIADKTKAVMIRDSTVMSAIPGILQLVCLMFAPAVELRVDRNMTKYVGLLCGCGTVPKNLPKQFQPVHPDNDMEIVFDTEIDDNDIDSVNQIRFYLNNILRRGEFSNKAEYHKGLRESVIKLLRRQRTKIDEEIWAQEEYVWNRISEDFIHLSTPSLVFKHDDIFQPHAKVKLNKVQTETVTWEGGY